MGLASEMKNLSEEVLNSFKQRMKENEELTKGNEEFLLEVQKTLDGFRKDHMEMAKVLNANAAALRNNLATGEKERLDTYNGLMGNIHSTISNIQNEVAGIHTYTSNMIKGFAGDRVTMADALDKFFAEGRSNRAQSEKTRMQNEKLRIKDFDHLMKNINKDLKSINDEVANVFKNTNDLIGKYKTDRQEMSAELKAELTKNLNERVEYTQGLLSGFQNRLSEIGKERQQMSTQLKNDLLKGKMDLTQGEAERHENYTAIMNGIQTAIQSIRKEVMEIKNNTSGIIGGYSSERSQAAVEWNKMQDAIAQLKKTGLVKPVKEVLKKTEKKAEKKTEAKNAASAKEAKEVPVEINLAENVKETLVTVPPVTKIKETPVQTPEPAPPMSLEEKIVDFINKHPKGVKISEMEKPLGETRMKLGYLAKNLLDAGKVQKIENVYFPLK